MNTGDFDIHSILDGIAFFEGISAQARDALAQICKLRNYKKREILFHEDDPGQALFVLLRGAIQLHKTSPDGKEVVIKVIKPGEVFAEVILFEEKCYPVTAIAIETSQALLIPKQNIHQLLEECEFRTAFITMLMKKQRYLSNLVYQLTSRDLEYRLRLFLADHFGKNSLLTCPMSKKDVAAALGTTPESLSRLLVRLKEEDQLIWQGNTINVQTKFWDE